MPEDPYMSKPKLITLKLIKLALIFSLVHNIHACSLVVCVTEERDTELYALSPDVLTSPIPSMLTLKVPYLTHCHTNHYYGELECVLTYFLSGALYKSTTNQISLFQPILSDS